MTDDIFWMVLGMAGPKVRHESFSDAKREAERLAAIHAGSQFFVLQAVCVCETEKPAVVSREISPPRNEHLPKEKEKA